MKTTKKQFRDFAKAFKRWQVKLNCNDWDVRFECVPMTEFAASVDSDEESSVAVVRLNAELSEKDKLKPSLAKHECLHLFLARYTAMATERYSTKKALYDEEERIVRMLERLISDDVDMTKLGDVE